VEVNLPRATLISTSANFAFFSDIEVILSIPPWRNGSFVGVDLGAGVGFFLFSLTSAGHIL
jgi:hypothetical protein